jgi:hypothetical protein
MSAPKVTMPAASAAGGSKPAYVPPSGVGPPMNATVSSPPAESAMNRPSRLPAKTARSAASRTFGVLNRKRSRPVSMSVASPILASVVIAPAR